MDADIFDYICERKIDLCAITETWLRSDDDATRAEMCPTGYKFLDQPRTDRPGGGTGLIFRDSLLITKIDAGVKISFEFSEWIVTSSFSRSLRIVILYRPPYSDQHKVTTEKFLMDFSTYLETLLLVKEELLIVGDFNIHVDISNDVDAIKFLDLLDSVGLQQHIKKPTHVHGHTLDLVITRSSAGIIQSQPNVDRFFSDHAFILCELQPSKPQTTVKTVYYRKLGRIDKSALMNDIAISSFCSDSSLHDHLGTHELDSLVQKYQDTLTTVIDQHAPIISKTLVARPKVPWYNKEIDNAKRQRRKAERTWRRTKSPFDFDQFKSKRNYAIFLMNQAKRAFYTEFIAENSNDQCKLFKAAKTLLGKNDDLLFPNHQDKTKLVNDIGRFFVNKIDAIRSDIDGHDLDSTNVPNDEVVDDSCTFNSFHLLSDSEVLDLMHKSRKKSCPLDPMPTPLVIDCAEVLLPVIKSMINSSLSSGYFPHDWKQALITPLAKKSGVSDFKNLRPVSNLQFISKLTERAVFNQLHEHLVRFDLFPKLQSAYRKSYSTETALLKVHNDLLMNMNNQKVTLLVLLDLSAAFDTVDHKILLSRLQSSFGIRGTALAWLSSYLSNRRQRIIYDGCQSEDFKLRFGLQQGSCLGPLLFTIYSSKLFHIIRNNLPDVHTYADDTQLYLAFSPNNTSQSQAIASMEKCIDELRTWMLIDKLKINDDKTEFMIIGTKQQLEKISPQNLTIGKASVNTVTTAKNLGTWLDNHLTLKENINKTCRTAYLHIHNIRHIRKYLTKDVTEKLVHAFVIGRIDYCNSILYGLPEVHVNKLQRVQNSAIRLITYTPRTYHITPVLKAFHWLPVKYRVLFKIAILTFKSIYGQSPEYLKELINIRSNTQYNLRSNNGLFLTFPTIKTRKTLGDRAFCVAAPTVWNNLPKSIRKEQDFKKFKSLLKTFLFKTAYN